MRRVLIVWSSNLLAAGIESLLTQTDNLLVMSAVIEDENSFREEIDSFHPDVIIVEESKQFPDKTTLFKLIMDYPRMRAVIVDITANKLQIYERNDVVIKKAGDLIAVVREFHFQNLYHAA